MNINSILFVRHLLFATVILVASCDNNKKEFESSLSGSTPIVVDFEGVETRVLKTSELFDSASIDFVELKNPKGVLLGRIDKLLVYNNIYYILDKYFTKSVYAYSEKGEFLFKIDKSGHGPGEYHAPDDFLINSEEKLIEILDSNLRRIAKYDFEGNFVGYRKLGFFANSFSLPDDSYYCFHIRDNVDYRNRMDDSNPYILNSIKFVEYDGRGVREEFPLNKVQMNLTLGIRYAFTNNSEQGIAFMPHYNDTIFTVSSSSDLIPKYIIDFGKNKIPSSFWNESNLDKTYLADKILTNQYACGIRSFFETTSHLCFRYKMGRNVYSAFYSKKSKKLIHGRLLSDDLTQIMSSLIPHAVNGESLVLTVNPELVHERYENRKSRMDESEWEKYLSKFPVYTNFINSTQGSENPYLVLVKLNDF